MVFRDFLQPSTQIFRPSGTSRLRLRSLPCGSLCAMAGDVWLVLSRSWPSTHFLPGVPSDSRVKFIWYPWISATWKCQVSEISPPSFDTLVSVMTLFHPYRPPVHLDSPHTHTLNHSLTLTHSFIHSLTHSVTHWYTHTHTHTHLHSYLCDDLY